MPAPTIWVSVVLLTDSEGVPVFKTKMKKVMIMAMFSLMGHTAMYSQQEEAKPEKGYIFPFSVNIPCLGDATDNKIF